MKMGDGRVDVFADPIREPASHKAIKWQTEFARKLDYDPREQCRLSLETKPQRDELFGLEMCRRPTFPPMAIRRVGSTCRPSSGHH